jgi:hypothetical protein
MSRWGPQSTRSMIRHPWIPRNSLVGAWQFVFVYFIGSSALQGWDIVMAPKKRPKVTWYSYILRSCGVHYRNISRMINYWSTGNFVCFWHLRQSHHATSKGGLCLHFQKIFGIDVWFHKTLHDWYCKFQSSRIIGSNLRNRSPRGRRSTTRLPDARRFIT